MRPLCAQVLLDAADPTAHALDLCGILDLDAHGERRSVGSDPWLAMGASSPAALPFVPGFRPLNH